jgi:hypothetical protein
MAYAKDRMNARGSNPRSMRVKVCWICDYDKGAVNFNAETGFFKHFCCERSTSFFFRVCQLEGGRRKALRVLEALGGKFAIRAYRGEAGEGLEHRLTALLASLPEVQQGEGPGLNLEALGWRTDWEATATGRAALEYARQRNLPEAFLGSGRAGYFLNERSPLSSRLGFVVFEGGKPVYAIARRVGVAGPRYLYPSGVYSGSVSASDVVFNLDLQPLGEEIQVDEGPITALSAGSVSILGKTLSPIQASKLVAKSKEFLLMREPGVEEETVGRNADLLRSRGAEIVRVGEYLEGDANSNPEQLAPARENARTAGELEGLLARIRTL